jgi:hypothetical protein
MKSGFLAALLAAGLLAACGVDSTPQSTGASGATSSPPAAAAAPAAAQEEKKDEPKEEAKSTEGEKKAQ